MIRKAISTLSLVLLFTAVMAQKPEQPKKEISIGAETFTIQGDLKSFELDVAHKANGDGLDYYTFTFTAPEKISPEAIEIMWKHPLHDIQGIWKPIREVFEKPGLWRNRFRSRVSTSAPVIALFSQNDENRYTYAASDALNAIEMSAFADEYTGEVKCGIGLFMEPQPDIAEYTITLRIDQRDQLLVHALGEVSSWWETLPGYEPGPVPTLAKKPMYSTWYAFHQDMDIDGMVRQCELAKEMGMESIIVDDGWQTVDSLSFWYVYTGDWKPIGVPDMKEFVSRVHGTGMKFLLWYSIPFMGERAENFDRFQGKYLYHSDRHYASVLDPRFPEVREYLINTFKDAMIEWDVDGFKLDFIDQMFPDEDTEQRMVGGRDYASVNKAIDRLMSDVMKELKAVKPDVMIEFRQTYIGPLMRKYGNMLRAGDCPESAIENRIRVMDLRMLAGNTAVHSDMIMWHPEESVEAAALQLLNILYSVPQVSVKLDEVTEEHRKMLDFWLGFWRQHSDVLLDGDLMPYGPALNYPVVSAENKNKKITSIYEAGKILEGPRAGQEMYVVNATHDDQVVLKHEISGTAIITRYDVMGKKLEENKVKLKPGYQEFAVPHSGLVYIRSSQ